MAEPLGLGLETGGTGTRWCVADAAGRSLDAGVLEPVTGHLYDASAQQRAGALLTGLAAGLRERGWPLHGLAAGVTGLVGGSTAAAFLRATLAAAFGVPASRVLLTDDMGLGYRARFAPGAGILIYSGTGSVGAHVGRDGMMVQAGGRGMLVDDAGAAVWIALRAVRAVQRREDARPGSGWSSPLGQALGRVLGHADWPSAHAYIYGQERGGIGLLARAVPAAAGQGDESALVILADAGRQLARLALVLRDRVGPRPVLLAGRAATLHPAIGAAFLALVPAPAAIEADAPDVAAAGACLAASWPGGDADQSLIT